MTGSPHVLIIGCGYVGRRAAVRWLRSGAKVSALTRSPDNARQLQELGITPLLGDVTQPDTLKQIPSADLVLYAVGLDRHTGHSQREVYVNGLEHVLQQLAERVGRFLYVSSTSVYGQNSGEIVDEDSLCRPTSPNGLVCLEAEQLISRYFDDTVAAGSSRESGSCPSANILRLAGIYGPQRLIARVAAIRSGELLTGNPDSWLNLIHVDDAVSAILACAEQGRGGRTYLVADNRPILRREYYEAVAGLVDVPPPQFAPVSEAERGQLNKRCSNQRLRTELQLELQYPDITVGLPHALGESAPESPA